MNIVRQIASILINKIANVKQCLNSFSGERKDQQFIITLCQYYTEQSYNEFYVLRQFLVLCDIRMSTVF